MILLGSAHATILTSNLDIISSATIGSGTLGTVTLTQNGADEVDAVVSLVAGAKFVNSGGPHTPFFFIFHASTVTLAVASPAASLFFSNLPWCLSTTSP